LYEKFFPVLAVPLIKISYTM